jgi:toxin ParE1/3/4
MQLVFTREAKADLDELREWLEPLSPGGLANVVFCIKSRIELGLENPRIGRLTPRDDVRELVEPRYGFIIPYYVKSERFYVLRIYRTRRKPLDYTNLSLV